MIAYKNLFCNKVPSLQTIYKNMKVQYGSKIFSPHNEIYTLICNSKRQGTKANERTFLENFMKSVGWLNKERSRLKVTGYILYHSVPTKVMYMEWLQEFQLPDSFSSWFTITELHVWLLLVRYMADDSISTLKNAKKCVENETLFVRNAIIEALWADVTARLKVLQEPTTNTFNQAHLLSEQFQAAVVGYDQGLHNDTVLAGNVWRRFFLKSHDVRAEDIEKIVHFIRHQLYILDKIPIQQLKSLRPNVEWLSIKSVKNKV